jgi:hypothetical protein
MNLDDIYEVHQSIRLGSFEADQFSTQDPTPRSTIPGSSVQGGGNMIQILDNLMIYMLLNQFIPCLILVQNRNLNHLLL